MWTLTLVLTRINSGTASAEVVEKRQGLGTLSLHSCARVSLRMYVAFGTMPKKAQASHDCLFAEGAPKAQERNRGLLLHSLASLDLNCRTSAEGAQHY